MLCKNSHEQVPENLLANGKCKICRRDRSKEKRRAAGILPKPPAGSRWLCDHDPATNMRPKNKGCAVCHREKQLARSRAKGVKPRQPAGSNWTCGHDPATNMRPDQGSCAQCHREQEKARYHANPEKAKAAAVAWQRANRDAYNARRRAWDAEKRRSTKLTDEEKQDAADYATIIAADVCVYCNGPVEHIDHIVALTRGGDGLWTNLAPACAHCNISKNARSLLFFLFARTTI